MLNIAFVQQQALYMFRYITELYIHMSRHIISLLKEKNTL